MASPDHDVVENGITILTRYDLEFYLAGGPLPSRVISLGKPTPDASGLIRVDFLPLLNPPLTFGVSFEARVVAVGPGGSGRSAVSNTFVFQQPCTTTLSPTSASAPAGGGPASFAVNAAVDCLWTAVSNNSWITITDGSAGIGNGTVSYTVSANASTSQRTGTITAGGQSFTVTQAGSCGYTVSPSSRAIGASGGSSTFSVMTSASCAWTAESQAGWITITAGASGSGNGTVQFSVAANTGGARTGTILIAGLSVTVNQAAVCTYTVSPASRSMAAAGASSTFSVTTAASCSWTAVSQAGWIIVTGGASGAGNGTVQFSAAANTGAARSGTILIAGQTVTVNQAAGNTCTYTVSPLTPSSAPAGGTVTIGVTAGATCAWTAAETPPVAWVAITSGASGTGNGNVTLQVSAHTQTGARTATLTIAGRTVTLTQNGVVLTSPTGLRVVK